jgi:hypothetical protein
VFFVQKEFTIDILNENCIAFAEKKVK